jgi:hypothetical protein
MYIAHGSVALYCGPTSPGGGKEGRSTAAGVTITMNWRLAVWTEAFLGFGFVEVERRSKHDARRWEIRRAAKRLADQVVRPVHLDWTSKRPTDRKLALPAATIKRSSNKHDATGR